MLDHETGKEGFIEFVRFVDFSGEFKPITNVGGANIAMAMGKKRNIFAIFSLDKEALRYL